MTPFQLRRAARCLRAGGIIAYPTEAVWGLGCDPWNPDACFGLLHLKQRDPGKGLILIADRWERLRTLVADERGTLRKRIEAETPRATTWLVPATREAPLWITGGSGMIAVRITRHPLAAALCREVQSPIVSTSANISGDSVARTLMQVRRKLGGAVDCYLPGNTGEEHNPSRIIRLPDETEIRA